MGATPTTDNKVADFFDGFVKAGITGGEVALKAYILTTPMGWIEGPFLHVFTDEILKDLGNALYRQAADLVASVVIDMQTGIEKSAAAQAVTQLQAAKAGGNADEIAKANTTFDDAMLRLIHWDGSSHA